MLIGACVGTNNLKEAKLFYDAVLGSIDMVCQVEAQHEYGYGSENGDPNFWLVVPYNEEAASFGNGTQVIFQAESKEKVQAFHALALKMGGQDEGAPGPRDYAEGYYGAYVRDLDGNKLHVSIKI